MAMDDFAAKQTKAKQMVQIYKPAHDSPMASATILVHTAENTSAKGKSSQLKSNQHQLAPINQSQNTPIMGDNKATDVDKIEVHVAVEMEVILMADMINRIKVLVEGKASKISTITEAKVRITPFEAVADNGMEMILITVTGTTEIEIMIAKEILIEADDGTITGDKDIVIVEEGEDGIPISTTTTQGIKNKHSFQTPITIVHHRWDINTDTPSHMNNIHIHNNNTSPKCHQDDHNKLQIFVSYAIIKAIMIINANLQVISWPAHKKPLIKADRIAIKTLIRGNGHRVRLITETLMASLFSNGGSRCC